MKNKIFKFNNRLIKFLLTIIGFGGVCGLSSCEYGAIAEYGVPYVRYSVVGTVESEDQSTPIPNIQVVMGYDTSYTDQNGNYTIQQSDYPEVRSYDIQYNDIDGVANGEYNDKDTTVIFDPSQASGGSGSWDSGEVNKEINIKLETKN